MAKKKQANTETAVKEVKKEKAADVKIPARLIEKYKKEITPKLMDKFSYKNIMQVPKLEKIYQSGLKQNSRR